MQRKSSAKREQYKGLCTTFIKILFNKNIVDKVTTDNSFMEKPGNWFTVPKYVDPDQWPTKMLELTATNR